MESDFCSLDGENGMSMGNYNLRNDDVSDDVSDNVSDDVRIVKSGRSLVWSNYKPEGVDQKVSPELFGTGMEFE